MTGWLILALLGIGTVATFLSGIGILVMKGDFNQLHYLGPSGTIGVFCIGLAVILDKPWSSLSGKTLAIMIIIAAATTLGTHLTARSLRIRAKGDWHSEPKD
jgi:multisubunit Na+/H+ antiporter MnhG subunit